ncbi:MAG TPA: 2-oxo-4-hydroxy-4-carboxy-5-ureidoimidazoline decarboxylase [Streptosporangiaceae bacterium]|jgi:2-oxo-4-hydroxy-4-carboxy-5-ureidoimidazoline decarboxylase
MTVSATALTAFNAAAAADAGREVARCCGSTAFVAAIVAGRPYADIGELSAAADAEFGRLGWADVAEALDGHPRIGERAVAGWSRGEQAGALAAPEQVARELADGNRVYEERFGHVFLVCASGLSGEQMLGTLRARLANDPAAERAVVTDELRKITQLRIRKLLGG